MSGDHLNVPTELVAPDFLVGSKVLPEKFLDEAHFFSYEVLYYNGEVVEMWPWDNREDAVKNVIEAWQKERIIMDEKIRSKDPSMTSDMRKNIGLLFMLLFWSNRQPVVLKGWEEALQSLSIKPFNVVERVSFIRENPKLYHSYIQLCELFQEQQKRLAKDLAIDKMKKEIK
ncbi:hypothetical protein LCM10_06360 [Rossellomorea aquimaris]|uniref:YpoC family protein n=1 Tax=Rossellomorea aquimaris TaxID=189382 RepID=UPI001CD1B964|nr:hypothetical protein [Rossellomorea aquimaris]MCA1054603.1 hypothetical protein [Rossellomorea aquimaris]